MFLVANIYNIFCICKFSFFSSPKPIGGRYYKNDTEKDDSDKAKWDAEQYMLHCDIVNELHGLAERGMSASVTNWSALTGLTSQHLATFHQHLSAPQYALSEREIIVSILIKLRFTPSEMAILFDCSKQIITNTRTSINHKLFHQEGTKTLDYNLKSL